MKKICLLFFFITIFSRAQIINFPDANFKNKLLTVGYACIGESMDNCFFGGSIDSNNNGEIEVSEAEAVAILQLSSANISDLTGIEYFINLERLGCAYNNLTSIDLSALTSLKILRLMNNQLSSLNLAGLNQLEELSCQNNQLTSLDISEQTQLKLLLCEGNQIS
jgi:Leucine-rich repeat (LRR) protein